MKTPNLAQARTTHTPRAKRAQSQSRAARAPRTARPPKPPLEDDGEAIPTSNAANTFKKLVEDAMRSYDFECVVGELDGILGLIEGNPAFASERLALRMICKGTDLLSLSPAIRHAEEVFEKTPEEEKRLEELNGGSLYVSTDLSDASFERDQRSAKAHRPGMEKYRELRRLRSLGLAQ